MPRFLTKIEFLDSKPNEKPFIMKALTAKNIDVLKGIIIPNLDEVQDREYRVLNDNIRQLEEVGSEQVTTCGMVTHG